MSYVLDGIETAMRVEIEEYNGSFPDEIVTVRCACGWSHEDHRDARPTIRFHYTHCPKAKKAPRHGFTREDVGALIWPPFGENVTDHEIEVATAALRSIADRIEAMLLNEGPSE